MVEHKQGTVIGKNLYDEILRYSILFDLPLEIWLLILSKDLNEKDLNNFFKSIPIPKFHDIIKSENKKSSSYNELWKLIFKNTFKNLEFPNISQTHNDYKSELDTKVKLSNSWKHSKGLINKYNLLYNANNNNRNSINRHLMLNHDFDNVGQEYYGHDNLIFNYPRVVSYIDGSITKVNLDNPSFGKDTRSQKMKKATKYTYIPGISPSNCTYFKLYEEEIVFGNSEGMVFIKPFQKKTNSNSIIQILDRENETPTHAHRSAISCIEVLNFDTDFSNVDKTQKTNISNNQYIITVDTIGNLKIWFVNNKYTNETYKKVLELNTVTLSKVINIFVVENMQKIILIDEQDTLSILELSCSYEKSNADGIPEIRLKDKMQIKIPIQDSTSNNSTNSRIRFVKFDYGTNNLIVTTKSELVVIKYKKAYQNLIEQEVNNDFYFSYKFDINENIQNIAIDEETCMRQQNSNLLGNDGCLISVMTETAIDETKKTYSNVYVFNIRQEKQFSPQIVLKFYEQCYTACVNKLLLIVYMEGKVVLYNALTGEELRIIKITPPPSAKKNRALDFNVIKTSKNKIALYGSYSNDLHVLHYNTESIQKLMDKGDFKHMSKKDRIKKEHLEEVQLQKNKKRNYGGAKFHSNNRSSSALSNESFLDEYLNMKEEESRKQQNIADFDIDFADLDIGDINDYTEDELIQLKIALSESLDVSNSNKDETYRTDIFGNIIEDFEKKFPNESDDIGLTEEEQLAIALSLSMQDK
ncbi:uncharacterized protein HGUI_01817 [Hanseniaspora guilliermondii]|uniref:Uncharacterized protein n=1 Tax=Hanseniaspora guilliermondii TaxID=56406 RepID=A0A1L0CMI3_9ASCO|nr:uncharacterized protein HGUI_01817 [Hanseniaspora guilliermondii]